MRGITLRIKHPRFFILMCLIIAISAARIALSINIPVVLFLAITLLVVVFCSKVELIACMCCLFPMLGIMQNRIALLMVAIGLLLRIRKFNWRGLIPLSLMMLWELLHAPQSHLELYGFLQDFAPLIALTVLLLDNDRSFLDFGFIARSFAYMTIVCSLINLMACSMQFGYSILSLGRLGNLSAEYEDFRGLINPNTNSFICLMAVSSLLLLRYSGKEKKSDTYTIVALLFIIILTQSKSAIICTAAAYLLYIFCSGSYRSLTPRKMMRLFALVFVATVGALFFQNLLAAAFSRFSSKDFTTGRTVIDLFYFRHITANARNLWFGTGLYKYTVQIRNMYPKDIWKSYLGLATMAKGKIVYKPCHLGILEIIVVWGLPGLYLVYLLIRAMLRFRKPTNRKIDVVLLIVIFIYCLQSGFIGSNSILHALIVILAGIKFDQNHRPSVGAHLPA